MSKKGSFKITNQEGNKIKSYDVKSKVFELIEECTELYMKLVSLYEDLGGNSGEFYEEIDIFKNNDLPVTDEEIVTIQNEMKKHSQAARDILSCYL